MSCVANSNVDHAAGALVAIDPGDADLLGDVFWPDPNRTKPMSIALHPTRISFSQPGPKTCVSLMATLCALTS